MTNVIEERINNAKPHVPPETTKKKKPELDPMALHGILGKIVRVIEPNTEADPAALLSHLIVYTGNALGRGPHGMAESTRHGTNFFIVIVGSTSDGAKGSSKAQVLNVMSLADPNWMSHHKNGLSTAEGLINAIQDGRERDGEFIDRVEDKRLCLTETEFATVLTRMEQPGNTLSGILREAFDGNDLHTITRNSPLDATNPHVSLVGHITQEELLTLSKHVSYSNGLYNRIAWSVSASTKDLPEGGDPFSDTRLAGQLTEALSYGRHMGLISRDAEARDLWARMYPSLKQGKPGPIGAITKRSRAIILRLQTLYAALDMSHVATVEHLMAAVAFWRYCEQSVTYIFGDHLRSPLATKLHEALINSVTPMTRVNLYGVTGNHAKKADMDAALEELVTVFELVGKKLAAGGAEVFHAIR